MISDKVLEKFYKSGDNADLFQHSKELEILDIPVVPQSWIFICGKEIFSITSLLSIDSDFFKVLSYYFWNSIFNTYEDAKFYLSDFLTIFFNMDSGLIYIFPAGDSRVQVTFKNDFCLQICKLIYFKESFKVSISEKENNMDIVFNPDFTYTICENKIH